METRVCPAGACLDHCERFEVDRDRPLSVRREDPDDPLCARPGCSVESWDWHACQMGATRV